MYRATRFEARARLRFRAFVQSQGTNSFYWPLIWRESLYDGFNVGVFNLKVCVDSLEVEMLHFSLLAMLTACRAFVGSGHVTFFFFGGHLHCQFHTASPQKDAPSNLTADSA